jgi:hypothetical protein
LPPLASLPVAFRFVHLVSPDESKPNATSEVHSKSIELKICPCDEPESGENRVLPRQADEIKASKLDRSVRTPSRHSDLCISAGWTIRPRIVQNSLRVGESYTMTIHVDADGSRLLSR